MKKINTISVLFTIFFLMVSCNSRTGDNTEKNGKNVKGEISISGAFALYPLTVMWAEEFNVEYPNIRIDISAGGAGKGMADALSGMVDLGMFSREVSPEEEAKGAWKIAVARDAVLPTCNPANPLIDAIMEQGLQKDQFREIFLKTENHNWKDYFKSDRPEHMNVYTRSDACGAAQMWGEYLGENQEELNGIGVYGDPGMADAVKNDPMGLGYNNVIYIYNIKTREKYKGISVIPIDLNENDTVDPEEDFYHSLDSVMTAIKNGMYPAPPARDLYFVARGTPEKPEVTLFLEWILTKGQNFVRKAGYVQLHEEKLSEELSKIQ